MIKKRSGYLNDKKEKIIQVKEKIIDKKISFQEKVKNITERSEIFAERTTGLMKRIEFKMKQNELEEAKYPDEDYARWHYSNGQKYLKIDAPDHYTLGLMEGKFLIRKIDEMKLLIKGFSVIKKDMTYKYLKELSHEYLDSIPEKYSSQSKELIDEIQGIADSYKRINFEDILVQNCFLEILYGKILPQTGPNITRYELGCTSFGVHQIIENEPQTTIGQNFDFNLIFKPTLSFVYHQLPNKPKIFGLRMGGHIGMPAGKTSNNVYVNINVVKTRQEGDLSIPSGFRSRIGFNTSKTAEDYYNMVKHTVNPSSYNLMIADPEKIIACQITPKQVFREDVYNTAVRSNTFLAEELQPLLFSNYSKDRQAYAEKQVKKKSQDQFTEEKLLSLLADYPIICRNSINPAISHTIAFITKKHFGIGNVRNKPIGIIPF